MRLFNQENRQNRSIKLLFETVEWLTARTVSPGNPARDDLLRALHACAESPTLPTENDLEHLDNALHAATERYASLTDT